MKLFTILREIKYLVDIANNIRAEHPDSRDAWSFALTNRSFLVPLFGTLLTVGLLLDLPFLAPLVGFLQAHGPEALADNLIGLVPLLAVAWGGLERLLGKTRAVWNVTQAKAAVEEAYAVLDTDKAKLAKAVRQALTK